MDRLPCCGVMCGVRTSSGRLADRRRVGPVGAAGQRVLAPVRCAPMWIRDIDVPMSVVEAHRAGDLVLFVGAGASVDPPSGLATFRELAAGIAADANRTVTEAELPPR